MLQKNGENIPTPGFKVFCPCDNLPTELCTVSSNGQSKPHYRLALDRLKGYNMVNTASGTLPL